MNLIFLGAPGAGKGTNAELIAKKYSLASISTGAILREAIKNETEMGKKAKAIIDDGKLVPDDTIIAIIKERLSNSDCEKGFILDGVPRTLVQARMIDELGIRIDKVINFEVSEDVVLERLSGRRVCADCGSTYHIKNVKSKTEGVCDRCGGRLIIRKDDQPETIKERMSVYEDMTKPLVDYYLKTGKLISINADKEIEKTSLEISVALER